MPEGFYLPELNLSATAPKGGFKKTNVNYDQMAFQKWLQRAVLTAATFKTLFSDVIVWTVTTTSG